MGSPISPILALIVMDFLLDNIIPTLPFKLPFLHKYVDDIVCAVPHDMVDATLHIFNSFDNNLQFTVEKEVHCGVPFLDTLLIRSGTNNKIMFDWYQKPSASGRFINYFSNHPMKQKFNTVIAMKNRIATISDPTFLDKNLKKLFDLFINNGYPRNVLHKLIYSSNYFDGQADDGADNNIKFKKLPYIEGLTDNVISQFKLLTNVKIAKYNTVVAGGIYTKTKDRVPTLSQVNTVYRIPCLECQLCYIGQSSQSLKSRITQHKSDSRIGKRSCALAAHFQTTNHNFDYNNVKILEIETNYKKRLFLEMTHINNEVDTVNFRSDINQLSSIYCNILNFRN